MKKVLNHIFIDGLSGMALGLFCTLIVGTILQQIGGFIHGDIGIYIVTLGNIAASLTGAGIGCGVARKYEAPALVAISGAVAGMIGAYSGDILSGHIYSDHSIVLSGSGEPLGAFLASFLAIEIGLLIAGKTQFDLILTPFVCISLGSVAGLLLAPPISNLMKDAGNLIHWATNQHPFIMGIVISILMGMFLTLPISAVSISVMLGLHGIAAGAATIGCCANMIGFAVISYRENKVGGLLAQGLGTSMLQMPNILKRPLIWLPPILTSAILGPISTCLLHMTNTPIGSGMGTTGLAGSISTYQAMAPSTGSWQTLCMIAFMHFLLPGLLALGISETLRKLNWIKEGDLKLEVN